MAGIYHERIYASHILYVMCLEEAASGRSLDSKLKYICQNPGIVLRYILHQWTLRHTPVTNSPFAFSLILKK